MNREQKAAAIEDLKNRFAQARLAILTDYKGLKVSEFNELRSKLREKQSRVQVVKNRLARIALKGSALEFLAPHLTGTTALTTTETDPTGPAKVIKEFADEHEVLAFKAAAMVGKEIDFKTIRQIAQLPGREELLARLMGSMMAPAKNWVMVLAQIPRQLVTVLAAVRDQKGKEG